jgi:uncharacterized protein YfaS (alpha-2-macroglobulin family)
MDDREQDIIYETQINEGPANGTIVRSFKVNQYVTGGEYLVKAEANDGAFPVTYRKIRIRSYQDREYIVNVDFSKESYMPGDIVRAKVHIKRLDGQPLPDSNKIKC